MGGKTLLRRALEAVPSRSFCRVTVVTQYDEAAALAESFGFDVVRNDRPEEGLSRTVHLGTEAMADCDAILYQVADQPLLTTHPIRSSSNAATFLSVSVYQLQYAPSIVKWPLSAK